MQYLVTSPTRVGSHFLTCLLHATAVVATKTHNPLLKTDYQNTCLIVLRRRDVFAAIMSSCIIDRTNEFDHYNIQNKPKRFAVDCSEGGEFVHRYRYNKWYYGHINQLLPWAQIEHFYFEDFVADFWHVYSRLQLVPVKEIQLPEKCPYRYEDIIDNVDECLVKFQYLQQYETRYVPLDKKTVAEKVNEYWDPSK